MTVLIVDNYDSFAHNLARYFRILGQRTVVVRSDAVTVEQIVEGDLVAEEDLRAIVLSPGPKAPDQAGICLDLVRRLDGRKPILGVCLGHQVIGSAYGAEIRQSAPVHGRASSVRHDESELFRGLPNPMDVARYHSLVVAPERLPDALRVNARTSDGIVMGIAHVDHPVFGVQFHPESVLSPHGVGVLGNFLRAIGAESPPFDSQQPFDRQQIDAAIGIGGVHDRGTPDT